MARPRINQFADDLSISRSQAVNLINKGRSKKDGGSQVLENNMNKMKGYKKGGKNSVGPIPLPDEAKRIRLAAALDPKRREDKEAAREAIATKNLLEYERSAKKAREEQRGGEERVMTKQELIEKYAPKGREETLMTREELIKKYGPKGRMAGGVERRGDDQPVIMAKDGKFVCRGGGAAVRGTGFSGVK